MKAYLAGAIEHAPDHGKAWRDDMSFFLKDQLDHDSYNPLVEEFEYLTPEESRIFRETKYTDLSKYQSIVRKLIHGDLTNLTTTIDYIVCFWDEAAEKGGGTYGELTVAHFYKIPVYMVTSKDPVNISGWILGCADELFFNFDTLKNFLKEKYGN